MAEFQEVMKQWRRFCKSHSNCGECEFDGKGICCETHLSGVPYSDIELRIMSWAAENPEPVYPTWIEWLKKFGIISFEPDFHSLLSAYPTRTNSVKAYINEEGGKPIPADIAQKLGIEPKEDA